MLTDKCKTVIDEALAVNGNYSKLSLEASAHLESCLECRRSLESIMALKASAASVLPTTSSLLKNRIASNLEGALLARKAAAASKSSILTGSIIAGIGFAGALALGIMFSDNKSETPLDNSLNNNRTLIQSVATESTTINSATSSNNSNINTDKLLKSGCNEDMRSHEPLNYPTQNVPSAQKDSNIKN